MHFYAGFILIIVSVPFVTLLSFDPFTLTIGLAILAVGLIAILLEYDKRNRRKLTHPSL